MKEFLRTLYTLVIMQPDTFTISDLNDSTHLGFLSVI